MLISRRCMLWVREKRSHHFPVLNDLPNTSDRLNIFGEKGKSFTASPSSRAPPRPFCFTIMKLVLRERQTDRQTEKQTDKRNRDTEKYERLKLSKWTFRFFAPAYSSSPQGFLLFTINTPADSSSSRRIFVIYNGYP